MERKVRLLDGNYGAAGLQDVYRMLKHLYLELGILKKLQVFFREY